MILACPGWAFSVADSNTRLAISNNSSTSASSKRQFTGLFRLRTPSAASCCEASSKKSSCSAVVSKLIPVNGPSQSSQIPSLNCGGQTQLGKGFCKLVKTLGKSLSKPQVQLVYYSPCHSVGWCHIGSKTVRQLDLVCPWFRNPCSQDEYDAIVTLALPWYTFTPFSPLLPLGFLNLIETRSCVLTITFL